MKTFRLILVFLCLGITGSMALLNCKSKSTGGTQEKSTVLNQLSEKEIEDGWILLFDGKSAEGWRGCNKQTFPDSGWVVEKGALKCQHSEKAEAGWEGDIVYDKKFRNFDLKLEWRIEDGGISGIYYLVREVPGQKIWYTAPKYQIVDNFSIPQDSRKGQEGKRRTGSVCDLIPPVLQNDWDTLEWNSAEIIVNQGKVVHKVNGETVLEYRLWTGEWNEIVANSRFPEYNPDFARVAPEGYIGLQDHGHATWFRNIKLKKL